MHWQNIKRGLPIDEKDDDELFIFASFLDGIVYDYIVGTWGALRKTNLYKTKKLTHYTQLPPLPI